jgi:hypothetical protein
LWIHPNEPGQRDRFANRVLHRLDLLSGIAVYPREFGFPPLPLLGLRALVTNNLVLTIHGTRREVNLRTVRKWWPWCWEFHKTNTLSLDAMAKRNGCDDYSLVVSSGHLTGVF